MASLIVAMVVGGGGGVGCSRGTSEDASVSVAEPSDNLKNKKKAHLINPPGMTSCD